MNKPQTWKVTPAQYTAMEAKVAEAGIPISGDSGTASHEGVTASWTYDGDTLSITVLSAPPFCTHMAQRSIETAVNDALNG